MYKELDLVFFLKLTPPNFYIETIKNESFVSQNVAVASLTLGDNFLNTIAIVLLKICAAKLTCITEYGVRFI